MAGNQLTYSVSREEIERRKSAFSAMLIWFLVSLAVTSALLFPDILGEYFVIFICSLVSLSLLFAFFRIATFRFFRSYLKSKYILDSNFIERQSMKTTERFDLRTIVKISVKRTSRNTIREIGLWFEDGKSMFIDGLDDFEDFRERISCFAKTGRLYQYAEPLDYDSVWFYPVFGSLMGVLSSLAVRTIIDFDATKLRFAYYAFGVYLFALGAYFILGKPLTQKYGSRLKTSDIIFGSAMGVVSLMIFLIAVRYN